MIDAQHTIAPPPNTQGDDVSSAATPMETVAAALEGNAGGRAGLPGSRTPTYDTSVMETAAATMDTGDSVLAVDPVIDRDEGLCMIVGPVAGDDSVHGGQTPIAMRGKGRIMMKTRGGGRFYRAKNNAISATSEMEQNVHDGNGAGLGAKKDYIACMGGFKC